MQIMSVTAQLDYPASAVWAVVSDFGGLKQWNAAVSSCSLEGRGVGAVRTFHVPTGPVRERIEQLDHAAMVISYSIVSGSSIKVRDGRLTISVTPHGAAASELVWSLDGEPDGVSAEALGQATHQRYVGRVEELRRYLAQHAKE